MSQLIIEDFLDEMSEGLIAVDEEGVIVTYNAKARQMLGAKRNCIWEHPAGTLKKKDIVILAYTAFGADKSGIYCDDLKSLGIELLKIEKGASLLAVGQYQTGVKGKSKIMYPEHTMDTFTMSEQFLGIQFTSKIDYLNRFVEIEVCGECYRYYYNRFFNHVVILDGETKGVKFYQMGGYTMWKEDLKDLMAGKAFLEKVKGVQEMPIEKHPIQVYHEEKEELVRDLLKCARGEEISYRHKSGSINGIDILSTLNAIVREGRTVGAYLLINDMSRVQLAESQRNIAFRKLEMANARLDDVKKYDKLFDTIIGSSKRMNKVKQLAYKASCFKSNVLILGESGTGKSILAKAIHEASERSERPFVHVNCNSIPETLIESELFGYEKGAFTGANTKGKKGFFELADGGTLFLDEIGDISKGTQVKLLQAIQNKAFFKVGGDREIQVDTRIIVATNRQLEKAVQAGEFREDLYYRINVFPIKQPPLRERVEDISDLVRYLLPEICKRVGVKEKQLTAEAYEKLRLYTWPGNVRELENVLERAVNLCEGEVITCHHLQIKVVKRNFMSNAFLLKPLKEVLLDVELDVIEQVLLFTKGDKEAAMSILKIKKTKLYTCIKAIKERKIP